MGLALGGAGMRPAVGRWLGGEQAAMSGWPGTRNRNLSR